MRAEADKDAEIAALRGQVRELELEREILRRAAKYFAGETSWRAASSSSMTIATPSR